MFDDQPGGSGQDQPQGKLILRGHNNAPASPQGDTVFFPPMQSPSSPENMQTYYPPAQTAQAPYAPPAQQAPYAPPIPQFPYAQQSLPRQASFGNARPGGSSDPIFKFLIIAIVVVVFSGVVFAAFASGVAGQIMAQKGGSGQGSSNIQSPGANPTQNTQGNNNGSQITATVPTPIPTLMPTPTPQLPLQITSINGQTTANATVQVSNNSTVPVNIHANQPNARARLTITYNVPSAGWTDRKRTDDNGDATLDWHIHIFNINQNGGTVTATIVAQILDQNGQQSDSAPVTVQITDNNGNNNGNGNGQNGNGQNNNGQNGNGDGQN